MSLEEPSSISNKEVSSLLSKLSDELGASSDISSLSLAFSELEKSNSSLESSNTTLVTKSSNLEEEVKSLKHQLDWFKKQLFGAKSERRIAELDGRQLSLGELLEVPENAPPVKETVKSYERKNRKQPLDGAVEDSGLQFDSSVPIKEVVLENPEIEGLAEDEYEVIGQKVTHRLAQNPSSYVVIKYVRDVVKIKSRKTTDTQKEEQVEPKIITLPAPSAVFEKSYADVSFLVCLMIDKFIYHLPLFRQHQRLLANGIKISRSTLTNLVGRCAELLEPIYNCLLSSIIQSHVLLMDETKINAGRAKGGGKMQGGYFWPVMGDKGEIAFVFSTSRSGKVVREVLEDYCGILVTDGYKVYETFAKNVNGVLHAQCWAHSRRKFVDAEKVESLIVAKALEYIRELYRVEDEIKERRLEDGKKLIFRREHSAPVVHEYFNWLKGVFDERILLPSSPFTKAANYALEREDALKLFLEYPNVPIDTNELEGRLRPIPMGRKNWLFCWTEVGARHVGIIQSIIQSCRMQGISPYTYLVDVLQRVETHPVKDIDLLTPRLWKENFADNPMKSILEIEIEK